MWFFWVLGVACLIVLIFAPALNKDLKHKYMLGYYYRVKSEYELRVGNYDECIVDAKESSNQCAITGMYTESGDALKSELRRISSKGAVFYLVADGHTAHE